MTMEVPVGLTSKQIRRAKNRAIVKARSTDKVTADVQTITVEVVPPGDV